MSSVQCDAFIVFTTVQINQSMQFSRNSPLAESLWVHSQLDLTCCLLVWERKLSMDDQSNQSSSGFNKPGYNALACVCNQMQWSDTKSTQRQSNYEEGTQNLKVLEIQQIPSETTFVLLWNDHPLVSLPFPLSEFIHIPSLTIHQLLDTVWYLWCQRGRGR